MSININNNRINYFILTLFFLLLIYSINTNLSFFESGLKHWSTYNKDDIVFVYNSLLYLEGLEQHHTDHPSLFTFIIFPIFYKIAFYLGYIDFYNLTSFLESENINLSLSKLFYISRFVIQIFSLGIVILVYKIANNFSLKKIDSLFISLLFILSTGFTSASNRIESGLISIFFVLLAFHFFLNFINLENKKNIIYFVLSLLFIFSAMMQKKLTFFVIPFIFFSCVTFFKKNEVIYIKYKFLNFRYLYIYLLTALYILVLTFIYFKTIDNNTLEISRDLDFIFLSFNYLFFNLICFFYIKRYQNKNYENLLTFNLLLCSTYFSYKFFLIYVFSAHSEIWTISFTNFLGHLNMFVGSEEVKGAFDFSSLNLYFTKFINNFNLVLNKYFLSYNYQSILVWSNVLLFINFFNKTTFKKKLSFLFLFFGFLIIQSIILFRYEQDTYYLNSELLLLFSLSALIGNFKNTKNYFSFLVILFMILFYSNIDHLINLKKGNLKSYCHLFKNSDRSVEGFYEFYTNKIPLSKIRNFCIDLHI